jgi:antitoxin component of MazEF toxin-antitoxin module
VRTQQYIMERIRYVGKISKQGNKRMVIIPTEYHDKVTRIGDRQVHVDISLVYDDNIEDVPKKSKK